MLDSFNSSSAVFRLSASLLLFLTESISELIAIGVFGGYILSLAFILLLLIGVELTPARHVADLRILLLSHLIESSDEKSSNPDEAYTISDSETLAMPCCSSFS